MVKNVLTKLKSIPFSSMVFHADVKILNVVNGKSSQALFNREVRFYEKWTINM